MKYTDVFGNICTRYVDRPEVVSDFFKQSNSIDTHNHQRQFLLALEKKWITRSPYFRLATTLIGINVVDAFLLCKYHGIIDKGAYHRGDDDRMSVNRFAGALARQLMDLAKKNLSSTHDDNFFTVLGQKSETRQDESPPPASCRPSVIDICGSGDKTLSTLGSSSDNVIRWILARKCKRCHELYNERSDTAYYCLTCGENMSLLVL